MGGRVGEGEGRGGVNEWMSEPRRRSHEMEVCLGLVGLSSGQGTSKV